MKRRKWKLKRVLALVLAFTMVMTMQLPSLAASGDPSSIQTEGDIRVQEAEGSKTEINGSETKDPEEKTTDAESTEEDPEQTDPDGAKTKAEAADPDGLPEVSEEEKSGTDASKEDAQQTPAPEEEPKEEEGDSQNEPLEEPGEPTLQERIDDLPEADGLESMEDEEKEALYAQLQKLMEEIETLEDTDALDLTRLHALIEAFIPSEELAAEESAVKIGETGYATLKEALKKVKDGETIQLLGDLTEDKVEIKNKKFILDLNGYTLTGDGKNPAVYIEKNSVKSGCDVTIQNGRINGNGQIAVSVEGMKRISGDNNKNAKVTLDHVTIKDNTNTAVLASNCGEITITNCVLSENNASAQNGGAVHVGACKKVTVSDTVVSGNSAKYRGGGIYSDASNVVLHRVEITNNRAGDYGGGIRAESGTVEVNDCVITGNMARDDSGEADTESYGGGIHLKAGADLTVKSGLVYDNTANKGSDIYSEHENVTMIQETVTAREGYYFNGWRDSNGMLYKKLDEVSGTIVGLTADWIEESVVSTGSLTIVHSAEITGSSASDALKALSFIYTITEEDGESRTVTIEGTDGSETLSGLAPGSYEISVQPAEHEKYVAAQPDTQTVTVEGDQEAEVSFRISYKKACTVTFDYGNETRTVKLPSGERVEEPADTAREGFVFKGWYNGNNKKPHVFAHLIYSDLTLTGKWEKAVAVIAETDTEYASLNEAFAAVTDGQTIRLLGDLTESKVELKNKKCILDLGGFTLTGDGVNPALRIAKNGNTKICDVLVQNGRIDGNGKIAVSIEGAEGNTSTASKYKNAKAALDHITIKDNRNQAVCASNCAEITITNCEISGNQAGSSKGGAVYTGMCNKVVISDSIISGNSVTAYGGGIYTYSGNVSLNHVEVTNNSAGDYGGGLRFEGGTINMTDCVVTGNTARDAKGEADTYSLGGGIYLSNGADLTVKNNAIYGNIANQGNDIYSIHTNGKLLQESVAPREGYQFNGWRDDDGELHENLDAVSGRKIGLTADWSESTGSLTINQSVWVSGGSAIDAIRALPFTYTITGEDGESRTVTIMGHNQKATLDDLKPGNYTVSVAVPSFDGYAVPEPPAAQTVTVKVDKTQTARFSVSYKAKWTVTFDYGDGKTETVQVLDYEFVAQPTDPIREGMAFMGWYNGENEFNFKRVVTSDLTLAPKWEKAVALIEETGQGYTTLKEAFAAVTDGQTIRLLGDLTESTVEFRNKKCTLDLGGFTLTGDGVKPALLIAKNGNKSICDVVVRNGRIDGNGQIAVTIKGLEGNTSPSYRDAKVTLDHITIKGNTDQAVWANNCAEITLTNCEISDNKADNRNDGVVYITGCNKVLISDSTISDNSVKYTGGGIYTQSGNIVLNRVKVTGNRSGNYGGGIRFYGGTITMTDCVVTENTARDANGEDDQVSYGGGIFLSNGAKLTAENNAIYDNVANKGNDIYGRDTNVVMSQTTVAPREGYRFNGWRDDDGNLYEKIDEVSGTTVGLTADWSKTTGDLTIRHGVQVRGGSASDAVKALPFTYTITGEDGESRTVTITGDGASETLKDLKPGSYEISVVPADYEGYAAAGPDAQIITVESGKTADVSFTVSYTAEWTVTFDYGNETKQVIVLDAKRVAEPADTIREGFAFKGWYNGTELYDFSDQVHQDLTLTADWVQYGIVKFTNRVEILGGSTDISSLGKTFEAVITDADGVLHKVTVNGQGEAVLKDLLPGEYSVTMTPAPLEGYRYAYSVTPETVAVRSGETAEIAMRHIYTAVYTISLDNNGTVTTVQAEHNTTLTRPADPTRKGYVFDKWVDASGKEYDFGAPVTGDVSLTATWKKSGGSSSGGSSSGSSSSGGSSSGGAAAAPTPAPAAAAPAAPAPAAAAVIPTAPEEPVTEPAVEIEDEETPLANGDEIRETETESDPEAPKEEFLIEDEETPLAGGGSWAVLNLLSLIVAVAAGLMGLIGKSGDDRRKKAAKLIGLLAAVAASVTFALTERMTGRAVMADPWTVLMVLYAAAGVVLLVLGKLQRAEAENE